MNLPLSELKSRQFWRNFPMLSLQYKYLTFFPFWFVSRGKGTSKNYVIYFEGLLDTPPPLIIQHNLLTYPLSGQVPDRNGKSILMASLSRLWHKINQTQPRLQDWMERGNGEVECNGVWDTGVKRQDQELMKLDRKSVNDKAVYVMLFEVLYPRGECI